VNTEPSANRWTPDTPRSFLEFRHRPGTDLGCASQICLRIARGEDWAMCGTPIILSKTLGNGIHVANAAGGAF
jgi:hypothetical protein